MIFCEGETERDLLDGLRQCWRVAHAQVEVVGECGDPSAVLRKALQRRKALGRKDRLQARFWVVFDRDEHHHFESTLKQAREEDVAVAWSNPCIELFGILFFCDQTAALEAREAQGRLHELHSAYHHRHNPKLEPRVVQERLEVALQRADRLLVEAKRREDPFSNPSTGIGALVRELRGRAM